MLAPGARVDYYVRALDEHGGVVAESGTPTLPFRLQVAVPIELRREPPRWYQKWWFWTAGRRRRGRRGRHHVRRDTAQPENELVISGPTAH